MPGFVSSRGCSSRPWFRLIRWCSSPSAWTRSSRRRLLEGSRPARSATTSGYWSACWRRWAARHGRSPPRMSTGWWGIWRVLAGRRRRGAITCRCSRASTGSWRSARPRRSRPRSGSGWPARWMSTTPRATSTAIPRPRSRRRPRNGLRSSSASCGPGSARPASTRRRPATTPCSAPCITPGSAARRPCCWTSRMSISAAARSGSCMCGSARRPGPRDPGRGGCRCWTAWTCTALVPRRCSRPVPRVSRAVLRRVRRSAWPPGRSATGSGT